MTLHKIAVVGAGAMAREHIKAFRAFKNCQITGIFSRTQSRAAKLAKEYNIEHVASSIEELYQFTKAHLVIITVPELAANQVIHECAQYDWQLFMEKPVGYDLDDAIAISNMLQQQNKIGFVGLNRRHYSSTVAAYNDLDKRKEARYIYIRDQQSFFEARSYNQPEKVVEKYMYANSIHNIDLFKFFGRGNVVNITHILPWQGEHTRVMLVKLEFASGDVGLYEGHWNGPASWSCQVSTPSVRWVMQPIEHAQFQLKGQRRSIDVQLDAVDTNFKPGFYRQAEQVLCYLDDQEHKAVTLDESMCTMRLIHQMFGV